MKIKDLQFAVSIIKNLIIWQASEMFEENFWQEFYASLDHRTPPYFIIYDGDLPIARDLKAILNMFTDLEIVLCKHAENYIPVALLLSSENAYHFYKNYKILAATNNRLSHYLVAMKDFIVSFLLPNLLEYLKKISKFLTAENFEMITAMAIEQIIALEQYRENYLRKKTLSLKNDGEEKKVPDEDDFFALLIKKIDLLLKKIYGNQYEEFFPTEIKIDPKSTSISYYLESKSDNNITKNLKFFFNGIISIKKVLIDHERYQQGEINKILWVWYSAFNLKKTYYSFTDFDHKAIIAEKTDPLTNNIKFHLQNVNMWLEILSCLADQLEIELHLKENTLLKWVEELIHSYNKMTFELKIPIDYTKQKNTYFKARMVSAAKCLIEIDNQIDALKQIIPYKNFALSDIPYPIILVMNDYVKYYHDDICLDKKNIKIYLNYLHDALNARKGLKCFLLNQIESLGNYFGITIHAALINALENRLIYLIKQQQYTEKKWLTRSQSYAHNPYQYFSMQTLAGENKNKNILAVLQKHEKELESEHNSIRLNSNREKNISQLKNHELTFFSKLTKKFEDERKLEPAPNLFTDKIILSAQSAILIDEAAQIVKLG